MLLHPVRIFPALLPRYVTRFNCSGANCEDNCCTAWKVILDKKTFNAYKKIRNPVLLERFANNIKKQHGQASDANYAWIELDPDTHECPFMEERLCSIQREMGEDKLSDTCFGYPRYSRKFGEQYEQALTLSCPEAARLALQAEDAFDFVQGSITVRTIPVAPARGIPLEQMNDIRIFCLQLMRVDGLELWRKLAILGMFCESLTREISLGGRAAVQSMFERFVAAVENGHVFDALADIRPDHSLQASAFVINFLNRSAKKISAAQDRIWQAIARGLGIDMVAGSVEIEQLTRNYMNGLVHLKEALDASPLLLEHYLLNEMFRELFPFKGASAYEHYLSMVSRFGILRLMLAAQCNTDGALPDAAGMVQTVQVFCRQLQHDSIFEKQANAVHDIFGWDKLEQVYKFLPA